MVHAEESTNRYRWMILVVLWLTSVMGFLNRLSVGPLAPFFKNDLGITSTRVGLIISASSIGYMLSLFPIGWVVDRVGAGWPMVTGILIAGVCMIALSFVPSYGWLLALMFATGLGCGFLFPSTTQSVMAWFPQRERATVMGFKQTSVNIAGIVTAATLPAIALALGWRYCFLFLGITALAVGVTTLILYREPPIASWSTGNPSPAETAMSLLEILKIREIWLVGFCGLCLTWVQMALVAHLVLYLTEELLFGVVAAGGSLAMAQAAGAIGKPGSGLLSDRIFRGSRKQVLMLMAGTTSFMCLMVGLFGSYLSWALYPVLFILGMGGLGFGGLYLTLMAEFGGRRGAGRAVALGGVITLVGVAAGPVFFGYIVDSSGSYKSAWISLVVMGALSVLLLLFVRESRREI